MTLTEIIKESVEKINTAIEQDFMFFNKNNPIEDSEWSLKDENRKYLYKIVEKTKDELEERQKNSNSNVKYHLISSQISLLEAELERKKKRLRDLKEREPHIDEETKDYLRAAMDTCKDDIRYFTEQIEEAKKLLNN
jgi:hypothetical protein